MNRRNDPHLVPGYKTGRWTLVKYLGALNNRQSWLCRCECGTERVRAQYDIASGKSRSCGCARSSHGQYRSPEYTSWCSMLSRCQRPGNTNFALYGGRGISVCDRWRESFADFLLDVGRRPSPRHSLDRIDSSGNYEPGNVRWATPAEQARNKRSSRRLTINGLTRPLADWAEELGLNYSTLYNRVFLLGWSVDQAISLRPLPPELKRMGSPLKAAAQQQKSGAAA